MLARSRPRKPPPISASGLCSFIEQARSPLARANPHGSYITSPMLFARQFPRQLQRRGFAIAQSQRLGTARGKRAGDCGLSRKASEVRRLPGWASLVSVSGLFLSPPRCSFRPPAFHGQWAPSSRSLVSGAPCPPPFASRRQAPCRLA